MKLQNYAMDNWHLSSETGVILNNAISGEPVAEISSGGLDFQDMVDYARNVGNPALQKMTFHQRALMLKQLGLYLMERKELFYECSKATGATRSDSWVDIEGGIGTLFSISSKARIEMPNSTIYIDGQQESLSRHGTFTGQHIYTPIRGVAVHINAYNFPCWGMLEKLAPALVAGVPCIIKPGSQTAFLTEIMVQHMVQSEILPAGAIQLICGGVGDLLDHLTYEDIVSFTGSAATGLKLKQHPVIAKQSTRFVMEADSLNCCILGSDVKPESVEFDLFIKEIVREMTTKAGQKCTAIRRAIVPDNKVDAVTQALSDKLGKINVGNPDNESVRMGALAGLRQRKDVRSAVQQLRLDSRIIFGDPDQITPIDASSDTGAFMSPVVMLAENPDHSSAHDIEAFGPVSTIIPYVDNEHAVQLAARGKGSLVGSLITNSPDVARQVILGMAPHHGRVLVLNDACAKESTGHGSPLPQLIHGGPGRAGGGEELGGVRGVKHYMQRTALQGSPDMLSAVTGVHLQGATRKISDVHPFKKHFEEIEIGDTVVTDKREITLDDIEAFAELTGDTFYAHMDHQAALRNPFFDGRVAHGYLLISAAAGLFVWPGEGPVLANTGLENLSFQTPVYPGDIIQVQFTCKQKKDRLTEIWGEVRWDTTIVNQNGEICAQYDVLTGVANSLQ
ncbi:MAG: phenylacetic acid degradation bifunctional protein PaaZ [Porticoccaceae bacterium]|jgi:oxepin-CoA hydrolase/3-oxo-5,6-dehydrosuberyl-CoA semialdehyde dehydrogenase|nr:phenylacetic acid degradation bifunctional protein PaaZ [Porticoccaceae bacterium]MBT3798956.1 phenylacetic acid degradation bifunctional protein PaaZ [Porticoccaceae bacterium]MBT4163302.1 phenylacetic acid degradation bifunctional protein PaaZ [Porticoccaceae bacterium]MBT4590494.1 phenylacetic acid degradation bifunctional protein PaaZ [Porticoccaceae bacterium]MBT5003756.1 phenylacetic acid degradation bifunctional protein PaaZ [Porticoccaceae bacterium]